ncbi:MAG TPA: leucine--tRNA ligase [Saprospiraceae bacterium]|nr:leucine--tRNA ligase [Saprospiraceae bacterium]
MDFGHIEAKWKKIWADNNLYKVEEDPSKPKYYVLDMFPYPSGAGLHVGHPLGYVGSDIYSRYKRMKGFNVLHPMGYDAFGLPAEQYALDTGVHPAKSTSDNILRYRSQLDNIGLSFDWSRQVRTDDPKYYRWTQWILLQLFLHYYDKTADKVYPISQLIEIFETEGSEGVNAAASGHDQFTAEQWTGMSKTEQSTILMNYRLAYRKVGYVNWCAALGTVLANDEVKDGLSERGGFPVVQKEMLQWSLRITAYAERLLEGMNTLQWSESMKTVQRNWIGKSEGAFINFQVVDQPDVTIKVFTTRPDTIYGATFIVLAPDHDLVPALTSAEKLKDVEAFQRKAKEKSADQRMAGQKKPDGMWLGTYALHPITGDEIQIWIADYVLKDYGTGAIMAVPGDDTRDKAFAIQYQLPVVEVIDRSQVPGAEMGDREGIMIHSDFLNGLQVPAAIASMLDYLEKNNFGTRNVEYKLRDANFSRQRYWGEPFPVYYDDAGIAHAMEEDTLPLELPDLDDFKPSPDGRSPLARLTTWMQPYPGITRETDTMPGYAGSSWYFIRYMDPSNDQAFASKENIDYWQDVDLYVGGVEHAVGHLMYSRFWHKFLYDLGKVPTQEPFKKLVNQGMIQGIVESVYLFKEKNDGKSHFISADLVVERNIPKEQLSAIPVHIDFVTDYGHPDTHLNENGIAAFIKWRPEYSDALFETNTGIHHFADLQNVKLHTLSEIGKMSKRYHNVVNPDDVISQYGADCFRMYEMFLGPIEQSKPWDTMGIEGVNKFLRKLWSLFFNEQDEWIVDHQTPSDDAQKALHATIKKINEDVERFSFNTAISQFMICVNELRKLDEHPAEILEPLVRTIAPFAPFVAEELWQLLGHTESVHVAAFPDYDEKWLVTTSITYPVCINGKKRGEINLPVGTSNAEIEKAAMDLPEIIKWVEGKPIRKVVIVPDKMINLVI